MLKIRRPNLYNFPIDLKFVKGERKRHQKAKTGPESAKIRFARNRFVTNTRNLLRKI
jgi:hypothetical protein